MQKDIPDGNSMVCLGEECFVPVQGTILTIGWLGDEDLFGERGRDVPVHDTIQRQKSPDIEVLVNYQLQYRGFSIVINLRAGGAYSITGVL